MNNILKVDFISESAKAMKAWKLKVNYRPSQPIVLDHALPLLASIPLVKNENGKLSATKIAERLDTDDLITTPNGPIPANQIKGLITCLYIAARSTLVANMTKNPRFGSLTPLVLYANRLHKDIPYEAWDKEDEKLKFFLGRFLEPIQYIETAPELTMEEINELREKTLKYVSTTSKKYGQIESVTNNKMNLGMINDVKYPKVAMYMFLQTWLANAEIRDTTSMILDPLNWDNVPEAVDYIPKTPKPEKVEELLMF